MWSSSNIIRDSETCEERTECWKREIPGTEKPKNDIPWDKIRDVIEDGMAKGDREIHLYFNPETGLSVNLYPWPDPDAFYEMYQKGQITQNDFREKMGLPKIENEFNRVKE